MPFTTANPYAAPLVLYLNRTGFTLEKLAAEMGGEKNAGAWLFQLKQFLDTNVSLYTAKESNPTALAYFLAALYGKAVNDFLPQESASKTPRGFAEHWEQLQEGFVSVTYPAPVMAMKIATEARKKDDNYIRGVPIKEKRKAPVKKKPQMPEPGAPSADAKPNPYWPEPLDTNGFGHALWLRCGGAAADFHHAAQVMSVRVGLLHNVIYDARPESNPAYASLWRAVACNVLEKIWGHSEIYIRTAKGRTENPVHLERDRLNQLFGEAFARATAFHAPGSEACNAAGMAARALCNKMLNGHTPKPNEPLFLELKHLNLLFPDQAPTQG